MAATLTLLSLPVELHIQILSHLPWQSHFLLATVCPLWLSILQTSSFRQKRYEKRPASRSTSGPSLRHKILTEDVVVLEIHRKGEVNTLIRTQKDNNSSRSVASSSSEEVVSSSDGKKDEIKEEGDARTIVCSKKDWPDKHGRSYIESTCLVIKDPDTAEDIFITDPVITDITASPLLQSDTLFWNHPRDIRNKPDPNLVPLGQSNPETGSNTNLPVDSINNLDSNTIESKKRDGRLRLVFYEVACNKKFVHNPPMCQGPEEFWDDKECSLQVVVKELGEYIHKQVFSECKDVECVWLIYRIELGVEDMDTWHVAAVIRYEREGDAGRLWEED